jgi:ADP-L-glycero-D-manno-heptose 6-epimerase
MALAEMQREGVIQYIPFPPDLRGKYQSFTEADISSLREAGYAEPLLTVEQGVARYCDKLLQGAP